MRDTAPHLAAARATGQDARRDPGFTHTAACHAGARRTAAPRESTSRPTQPAQGSPLRGAAEWHIGVGHGHFLHPLAGSHSSYHIYEEHLAVLDHDYIALGHWEQQTRVEAGHGTVAAYSGAPDGLAGKTGGAVLLVHLEADGRVRLESHPVQEHRELMQHDDLPLLSGVPLPQPPITTP